jgi:hypothetical protein
LHEIDLALTESYKAQIVSHPTRYSEAVLTPVIDATIRSKGRAATLKAIVSAILGKKR